MLIKNFELKIWANFAQTHAIHYVAHDERALVKCWENVDASENNVDWLAFASAFPPAFDDASIVSVDLVTVSGVADCE